MLGYYLSGDFTIGSFRCVKPKVYKFKNKKEFHLSFMWLFLALKIGKYGGKQ